MPLSAHHRQQLRTLNGWIEHIGAGMLTSTNIAGRMTSRPMTALSLDRNGSLWFFTRAGRDSTAAARSFPATCDATSDAHSDATVAPRTPPRQPPSSSAGPYPVNIAFVQPDEAAYVSISGLAHVVHDRSRIDALWSPVIGLWFAQGKHDPELALLRVDITQADYWDASAAAMVNLLGGPEVSREL